MTIVASQLVSLRIMQGRSRSVLMATVAGLWGASWLIIGVTKFTWMPFFAAVKEAKFRSFVSPGMTLTVNAALEHEGSGYAVARADSGGDRDGVRPGDDEQAG